MAGPPGDAGTGRKVGNMTQLATSPASLATWNAMTAVASGVAHGQP